MVSSARVVAIAAFFGGQAAGTLIVRGPTAWVPLWQVGVWLAVSVLFGELLRRTVRGQ